MCGLHPAHVRVDTRFHPRSLCEFKCPIRNPRQLRASFPMPPVIGKMFQPLTGMTGAGNRETGSPPWRRWNSTSNSTARNEPAFFSQARSSHWRSHPTISTSSSRTTPTARSGGKSSPASKRATIPLTTWPIPAGRTRICRSPVSFTATPTGFCFWSPTAVPPTAATAHEAAWSAGWGSRNSSPILRRHSAIWKKIPPFVMFCYPAAMLSFSQTRAWKRFFSV